MPLSMRINSAYICVKDMNRAIDFYEKFFEQDVYRRDDIFSIFDIHGLRLCLFNNQKVNESVTYGDNCLLSIEANDVHHVVKKLNEINASIVFPLTRIGDNLVLEFKDSEGNDMEVYCKATKDYGRG